MKAAISTIFGYLSTIAPTTPLQSQILVFAIRDLPTMSKGLTHRQLTNFMCCVYTNGTYEASNKLENKKYDISKPKIYHRKVSGSYLKLPHLFI